MLALAAPSLALCFWVSRLATVWPPVVPPAWPAPPTRPAGTPLHAAAPPLGGGTLGPREVAPVLPAGASFLETLVARAFDRTVVICYKRTCEPHHPGGGMWSNWSQPRIIVQDGADTDLLEQDILERYGSNHIIKPLVSHLLAVDHAASLNLSSVLVLEADVKETPSGQDVPLDAFHRLEDAVWNQHWQILRLSGEFAFVTYQCDQAQRSSSHPCLCRPAAGWPQEQPSGFTTCVIAAALPSDDRSVNNIGRRCDIRSTVAYAARKSAFAVFSELLRSLRQGTLVPPTKNYYVDWWLPAAFDNHYLLPSPLTEPRVARFFKDSEEFQRCEKSAGTATFNYTDQ